MPNYKRHNKWGADQMKKSKKGVKKNSKSKKFIEKQKHLYTESSSENLKANFEVVTGICKMMEQSTGEKQVFERMLNLIGKSVEFSRSSLFLLNKSNNQMEEVASVGKKVDLIDFVRFDAGAGLSAWVAKEKRPILLSNLHRKRSGEGIKSFLSIPLILNGDLFGVMNFGHIRAHAFEPEDVKFLTSTSLPVTLSLERMSYRSRTVKLESELEQVREHAQQLQTKITQMESMIPTPQLLENLSEKIKTPLSSIVENAEFLLNCFSPRQSEQSFPQSKKDFNIHFKRGLRQIKSEVNQITQATEKLLKRSFTHDTKSW
jgi:transcriptional regulator with GAF, ATPase, and Fis domain